jgi:pimeloyl-ACP methyl ester carboxylesterase
MASLTRMTLPVNGFEMRLLRGGEGAPLLYLHGAGGAPAVMEFMELLADRFEVIVPEHPGFGASEDPGWFDNIHDLAYYYLDALEVLGLEDVHLVGNSLGGWIALEVAVRNTSRLKSLTLVGAAGIDLDDVPRSDMFMWTFAELARHCFHDPALAEKAAALAEEATPEQLEVQLKNQRTVAKVAWAPRWYDPHLDKWLHRIDVPTHVIWAADDRILDVAYAEAFADAIAGAHVTIVPECGHLIHAEKPAEFSRVVSDFIEGLAP